MNVFHIFVYIKILLLQKYEKEDATGLQSTPCAKEKNHLPHAILCLGMR